MTTIAYRDGVVASDSYVTQGNLIHAGTSPKLVRGVEHPVIYALAGTLAKCRGVIAAIERCSPAPWEGGAMSEAPHDDGDSVAVFCADGRIFQFEGSHWFEMQVSFLAFGSGSRAAMAAMHMGASARRAVEIAALCDIYTGGPIVEMRPDAVLRPVGPDSSVPRLTSIRA